MRLEADKDCFTCEYCHSIFFPEKDAEGVSVLQAESDQNCPICAGPLALAALAKIRIRYCTHCRGMLVPMPAFLPLVEELRAGSPGSLVPPAPDPSQLHRRIACPQCHQPMDTHFYAGPGNVVIDDCSTCLLNWLDHGELMRIVRAPDHTYTGDEELV